MLMTKDKKVNWAKEDTRPRRQGRRGRRPWRPHEPETATNMPGRWENTYNRDRQLGTHSGKGLGGIGERREGRAVVQKG